MLIRVLDWLLLSLLLEAVVLGLEIIKLLPEELLVPLLLFQEVVLNLLLLLHAQAAQQRVPRVIHLRVRGGKSPIVVSVFWVARGLYF